jgi:hypothetical protein
MLHLSNGGMAGEVALSTKFVIFEWAKAKAKKSFDSTAKTSSFPLLPLCLLSLA